MGVGLFKRRAKVGASAGALADNTGVWVELVVLLTGFAAHGQRPPDRG